MEPYYSAIILLLLAQAHLFIQAASQNNQLKGPFNMTATQRLTSSSGTFAFGLCNIDPSSLHQTHLLLAVWFDLGASGSDCSNKAIVWFARDPTSKGAVIATQQSVLRLDSSNGLSLVDGQATLWSPSQQSGSPSSSLMLLDSGNLQLLAAAASGVSWQSFDHPTHTLLPGQSMTNRSGMYLQSKNTDTDFSPGRYTLIVQDDDNVVLYMRDADHLSSSQGNTGDPYWESGTWDNGRALPAIALDNNGNLFYNDSKNGYKNLTTRQPPTSAQSYYYHYAALDPDGTVRVYAQAAQQKKNLQSDGAAAVWDVVSLFPGDGCSRKTKNNVQGICGPNALCKVTSLIEQRISCECPDGYVFVDEQHGYRGCRLTKPRRISMWFYFFIVFASLFLISVICNIWQCQWYAGVKARSRALSEDRLITFTRKELKRATNGFSDSKKLGQGSFGIVYHGTIKRLQQPDVAVAVKVLNADIKYKNKEFKIQLESIGKIHHKNLVPLIGQCEEGEHRMLVFEFMQGGTLENFIFGPQRPCWSCRAEAAIGIARGLEYLHEGCRPKIIHCDIKPDNILFDAVHVPKITDFGIAKLLQGDKTRKTAANTLGGTKPYMAPEWDDEGAKVSGKADVYSFGVVLLEMVCCKKAARAGAGVTAKNQFDLGATVERLTKGDEEEAEALVQGDDEALEDIESVRRFAGVAVSCLKREPSDRPTMRKVVLMLEGTVQVHVG